MIDSIKFIIFVKVGIKAMMGLYKNCTQYFMSWRKASTALIACLALSLTGCNDTQVVGSKGGADNTAINPTHPTNPTTPTNPTNPTAPNFDAAVF